jgi:hypothetical protein
MKSTLPIPLQPAIVSASEDHVIAVCQAALEAVDDCVRKAVLAGFFLLEYRQQILTAHCEPGKTNDGHQLIKHGRYTPPEQNFSLWIESNGIPISTAKRWMCTAERIARLELKLDMENGFVPFLNVDNLVVPLSQALTAPENDLPQRALEFRSFVLRFLKDKSLAEAARAAIDGDSPANRVTRAGGGKLRGGKDSEGRNRRDFPRLVSERMHELSAHLRHWNRMTPSHREAILDKIVVGCEKWPTPVIEHLAKAIKLELQRR